MVATSISVENSGFATPSRVSRQRSSFASKYWIALSIGLLIPNTAVGISTSELIALILTFSCGILFLTRPDYQLRLTTSGTLLLFCAISGVFTLTTAWGEAKYTPFCGLFAFVFFVIVGATVPSQDRTKLGYLLFCVVVLGTFRDLSIDFLGLAEHRGVRQGGWETGARGVATARSNFAAILPVFAAPLVFSRNKWMRPCGYVLIAVAFCAVTIVGQGRGSTLLLGIAIILSCRTVKSVLLMAGLLGLASYVLFVANGTNDLLAPFVGRVVSAAENLQSEGRIVDLLYVVTTVANGDAAEWVLGMPIRSAYSPYGGLIHSGYGLLYVLFGVPVGLVVMVFCFRISSRACRILKTRNHLLSSDELRISSVCAIVFTCSLFVSPVWYNWQAVVIPALLMGFISRHHR